MNLKLLKVNYSSINENFEPILNFSIFNNFNNTIFIYQLLLEVEPDGYIPVIYQNKSEKNIQDNIFLVFDYNPSLLIKEVENLIDEKDNIIQLIRSLVNIFNLETDTSKKHYIYSTIFLLIFLKNYSAIKPSILLYIFKKLYKIFPEINLLLKEKYSYINLIEILNNYSDEFFYHLIFIDADNSLLNSFQNMILNIQKTEYIIQICNFILICKLNKNRIRKLINQIDRLNDLNKISFFINKLKEEESFFNNNKITHSQKEIKFSNILDEIINPVYFSKYKEYLKGLNSLNLKILNIKNSLYFEKNEYTINAIIKNKSDIKKLKEEIEILEKNIDMFY